MNKIYPYTILLLFFISISFAYPNNQTNNESVVFVCNTGKVYHYNDNCDGLKNCRSGIKAVNLKNIINSNELKEYNKRCGWGCEPVVNEVEKVSSTNNILIYVFSLIILVIIVLIIVKKSIDKNLNRLNNKIDKSTRSINNLMIELKESKLSFESLKNEAHYDFMINSIKQSKKSILISSGWVSARVVDSSFYELLKKKLDEGVDIFILYGYRYNGEHKNTSPKSIEYLNRLANNYPKIMSVKSGTKEKGNHSKCLIIDNETTAIGSYNWLSSGKYLKNYEESVIVKDKEYSTKQCNFYMNL